MFWFNYTVNIPATGALFRILFDCDAKYIFTKSNHFVEIRPTRTLLKKHFLLIYMYNNLYSEIIIHIDY